MSDAMWPLVAGEPINNVQPDVEDMKMRRLGMLAVGLALLVGLWVIGSRLATAQVYSNDPKISLMDNCDPAAFLDSFCVASAHSGDVTAGEFLMLLYSPLSKTIVGHPGWRFEPGHLTMRAGQTLRVTNNGGEDHTFTEVIAFGGGNVPPLNGVNVGPPFVPPPGTVPLTPAAACLAPSGMVVVDQGQTVEVKGLSPGLHQFQCCIHPWMHAAIRVN
jgi:plastocyanin